MVKDVAVRIRLSIIQVMRKELSNFSEVLKRFAFVHVLNTIDQHDGTKCMHFGQKPRMQL